MLLAKKFLYPKVYLHDSVTDNLVSISTLVLSSPASITG